MQIVNPFVKFDRVKKAVIGEIQYQPKMGSMKIYSLVIEEFGGNVEAADLFMTSKKGGYTEEELNDLKYRMDYLKKHRKRQVSSPVETF